MIRIWLSLAWLPVAIATDALLDALGAWRERAGPARVWAALLAVSLVGGGASGWAALRLLDRAERGRTLLASLGAGPGPASPCGCEEE